MKSDLKVQIKNAGACEKTLAIDVPTSAVQEEYNSFYLAVSKRAKIPGFRPGHAPLHVIKIHFQKEAREEVLKHLLSRSFREAVEKESLSLVGEPSIELVEFDENRLKFNAHIESRPKIKLDKYAGLPLERRVESVQNQEIEDVLKRIQEANAKYEPVENRAAALGDYLVCDYQLLVDGKEEEKREETWIQLREDEYFKGFSAGLQGVRAGENREVAIHFPESDNRKNLAGKAGIFSVRVKEVKQKTLPPVDDELAKSAGNYDTLQALKEAIRKDLEAHKRREAETKMEEALMDELIKRSKFDLPKKLLERRNEALMRREIESRFERGMSQEEATKDLEELRKEIQKRAERYLRISFILDEIAGREQIRLKEDDLELRYRLMAERFKRPLEEIKQFYREHETEFETLNLQIVSEKTIEWLKGKANIKEITVQGKGGVS